jgi:thioredoxin-related protein
MRYLPLLAVLAATVALRAEPEYPKMGPDIFDPKSDGTTQIISALTQARAEHKNVLLMFGANWCVWCHRLKHTMDTDATVARTLDSNYVLVLIDVNMRHGFKRNTDVNDRYGNPIHEGLPVLVVLDGKGKQLFTQESGALEEGEGHSPAKVTAFLQKWAPKKPVLLDAPSDTR